MSLDKKQGQDKLYAFEINNIMKALRQQAQNIIDLNSSQEDLAGIYQDKFIDDAKLDKVKNYLDQGATSGQPNVIVNSASQFSQGEMVIIYDGVDAFETATIQGKNGNTLTMTDNLANNYDEGASIGRYLGFLDTANNKYQRMASPDLGNGSDGEFMSSGDETWSSDKNFTSIQIQNGHAISISGNIQIKCTGDILIENGGKLSAKGRGHGGGGSRQQGASYAGSGTSSQAPNGGGGGGGYGSGTGAGGGGGGGYNSGGGSGGYVAPASSGERGQGGGTYNNPQLSNSFTMAYLKGSGGGGGGAALEGGNGGGGSGGGIIRLHCKNLIVDGEIDCNGGNGGDGSFAQNYNTGGGGGGSGGTIFLQVLNKAQLGSGKVHANGGAGGVGRNKTSTNGAGGGGGGAGRIRIECNGKISGSTSPSFASGYNDNVGSYTKYGWYFTKRINILNSAITVNCYIKQEVKVKENVNSTAAKDQPDIAIANAGHFEAGDKVIILENDKMEIKEIESINNNILTLTDNLENDYSINGKVLRIDAFGFACLKSSSDNGEAMEMNLQTVENLGNDIWYLSYSKTIKEAWSDQEGVNFIGIVKLKGRSNNSIDVNIKEVNWSYY